MVWLKYNAQFIDVVGIGDLLICNLTIRLEEKQCRLPVSSRTTTHPINMASYHMNLPVARSDVQNPPRPQAQAYWGLTQVPRYPPPKPLFCSPKVWTNPLFAFISHPPCPAPLGFACFFHPPPTPCPPPSHFCCMRSAVSECFIFCHRAGLRQAESGSVVSKLNLNSCSPQSSIRQSTISVIHAFLISVISVDGGILVDPFSRFLKHGQRVLTDEEDAKALTDSDDKP